MHGKAGIVKGVFLVYWDPVSAKLIVEIIASLVQQLACVWPNARGLAPPKPQTLNPKP